jgi:hypothetical protein
MTLPIHDIADCQLAIADFVLGAVTLTFAVCDAAQPLSVLETYSQGRTLLLIGNRQSPIGNS